MQNHGLEATLISSSNPCVGSFPVPPLAEYFLPLSLTPAIPLFIGGGIRHDLLASDLGITCFSGSTGAFVALMGSELLTAGVLAHELGHVLSDQNHTSDPANLMTPPDRVSRSIRGTTLTSDQCALARCRAKHLLTAFGRPIPAAVASACVPFDPVCGNGVVETGEGCDDGNGTAGDGCRADCTVERCGDGIVDPSEQCDFGDPKQQENCTAKCRLCAACNVCGDGILAPGEECDDGNKNPKDKCDNSCRFTFG